jgi:hypothetical protein
VLVECVNFKGEVNIFKRLEVRDGDEENDILRKEWVGGKIEHE